MDPSFVPRDRTLQVDITLSGLVGLLGDDVTRHVWLRTTPQGLRTVLLAWGFFELRRNFDTRHPRFNVPPEGLRVWAMLTSPRLLASSVGDRTRYPELGKRALHRPNYEGQFHDGTALNGGTRCPSGCAHAHLSVIEASDSIHLGERYNSP